MPSKVISSATMPIPMLPLLEDASYVEPATGTYTETELRREIADCSALICLLSQPVGADLMDEAPGLKVVANYAVGFDNVDIEAATARGIAVTNTPEVLTNASADLAFALILAAARRLREGELLARSGEWKGWHPTLLRGYELAGRRLGIIGAGRIGRAVIRRARGFEMDCVYVGRSPNPEADALGAQRVELEELLESSDVVSLHCPLNEGTRRIIDARALELMKPSAILVNTARGGCVDQEALAAALESGAIAGAGLDVFEGEPAIPESLLARDNAILLPHIGSATYSARAQMATICAEAVNSVLRGERPATLLNPEVFE